VFLELPESIRAQLLLDRDSHGNVQVSKIETEKLLIELVHRRLHGSGYRGRFQAQPHFFGYEGRCAAPSNFDADYTYALGRLASVLVAFERTGYLCGLSGLSGPAGVWSPVGIPLTSMMQLELRKGRPTPVIGKALVQLDAEPFLGFADARDAWALNDDYRYPGAIQYFGPDEVTAGGPLGLVRERGVQ